MAESKTDMAPPTSGEVPTAFVPKLRSVVRKVFNDPKNDKIRKEMDRFLEYFKGNFWSEDDANKPGKHDSEIFGNLIYSTCMTTAPLLTDNRPVWSVRAKEFFMQRQMDAYKPAVDYLWETEDVDFKVFKTVLDSLIMKMGIGKVFYDPDKGFGGDVSIGVVDPRTFVIAPGYDDPWDAPWCGTVTRRPLDWVWRRYPKFRGKVKPDGADADSEWNNKEDCEVSTEFVKVYDIFMVDETLIDAEDDKGNPQTDEKGRNLKKKKYPEGRVVVFVESLDEPLDDREYPYSHGKAPYSVLYDGVIPHEFIGSGEVDQIETLVLEFNLALRKVANFVRRWVNPNFTAEAGCGITPEQWKRDAPGGGNLFLVNGDKEPPTAIEMKAMNSTALDFISALMKLVEEVSGVTDVTKGMVSKKQRQSAREIATILETSYTRTRQRVRNLERFLKRMLWLVLELMQQYYDEPRSWNLKTDSGVEYGTVNNTQEFAGAAIKPNFTPENEDEQKEWDERQKDYELFLEKIKAFGETDKVHSAFDITIDTNSTLPMDKQSLANLFLKLFELKAIDEEALLETLRIPKYKEIIERLIKRAQGQLPGAPGAGAGDVAKIMQGEE